MDLIKQPPFFYSVVYFNTHILTVWPTSMYKQSTQKIANYTL